MSWQTIVSSLFGMLEASLRDEIGFRGEVLHSRVGELDLTDVACSSEFVERTARHVNQDIRDVIVLVSVRQGNLILRQGKSECRLSSGTSVLYASSRPFTWEHAESTQIQNVAIPRALLAAAIPQLERHLLVPYDHQCGMWRVATDFVGSLKHQMRAIPDAAAGTYARQLIDLIAVAVEAGSETQEIGGSAVRTATLRRCLGYIRQHLHDPMLAPAQIAAAAGISLRYLHRLFSESGTSVGEVVLTERLRLCHAQLADPINLKFRIAEIAYRAGFRSQAHFAHAFRMQYGMSPSERRRQALRGA